MTTQTEQTITTQTTDETQTTDAVKPTAIDKCIDKLASLLWQAVTADESPAIAGQRAMLDTMRNHEQSDGFANAIAVLEKDIEAATAAESLVKRAALHAQYGSKLADVMAFLAPPAPIVTAIARPTSSKRSDSAPRTVARTIAEIDADSSIEYIGAPIENVDALGHDCSLSSILRNGCTKVANLKQQITRVEDDAAHDECVKLAQSVRVLFRRRAELRNANAA